MLKPTISIFLQNLIRFLDFFSVRLKRLNDFIIKRQGLKQAKQISNNVDELKLDLGGGFFKRPGYVIIDLLETADIQWDIRWGLPFKDSCVTNIRSDHFFEHLELPDLLHALQECRRVLIPGGELDFTVPHIDPYLDAYNSRDFGFLKEKMYDVPSEHIALYGTCFDRISWLLYRSGAHKSFFDKESIIDKVKLSGFINVRTREFDQTKDTNTRFSSLYVVAIK